MRAEVAVREWPGISTDKPHGTPYEKDYTSDPFQWCESCGGVHHRNNLNCNGLRDDVAERCDSILGESRCDRPLGHIGTHVADSTAMHIEWSVKR